MIRRRALATALAALAPVVVTLAPATSAAPRATLQLADTYFAVQQMHGVHGGFTTSFPLVFSATRQELDDPIRILDDGGLASARPDPSQSSYLDVVPGRDQSGWFTVTYAVDDPDSGAELGRGTTYIDVAPRADLATTPRTIDTVVNATALLELADTPGLGAGDHVSVAPDATSLGMLQTDGTAVTFSPGEAGTDDVTLTLLDAADEVLGTVDLHLVVRPSSEVALVPDEFTVAVGDAVRLDLLANDVGLPGDAVASVFGSHYDRSTGVFDARGLTPGDYSAVYGVEYSAAPDTETVTSQVGVTVHVVPATGTVARDRVVTYQSSHPATTSGEVDTPVAVDLSGAVASGAKVTVVHGPSHGTFDLSPTQPQGQYVAEPGFAGTDTIVYRATSSSGATDTGTVFVRVPRGGLGHPTGRAAGTSIVLSHWGVLRGSLAGLTVSVAASSYGWSGPPPADVSIADTAQAIDVGASTATVSGLMPGHTYRVCLEERVDDLGLAGEPALRCTTTTTSYRPQLTVTRPGAAHVPAALALPLKVAVTDAEPGSAVVLERRVTATRYDVVAQAAVPAGGSGPVALAIPAQQPVGRSAYRVRLVGDAVQDERRTTPFQVSFFRLGLGQTTGGTGGLVTITDPGSIKVDLSGLVLHLPTGPDWPLKGVISSGAQLRVHPETGHSNRHDLYLGRGYVIATHGTVSIRTRSGASIASLRY